MATQADQFNAELAGTGSLVDREYSRLLTKTGQPAGRYSLRDLYELASESPRIPLGRYVSVGPSNLGYGNNAYGNYPYGD
ncbi:MAG TPA: hypothetical protein VGD26_01920 [Chitinophagaceae bacterium]